MHLLALLRRDAAAALAICVFTAACGSDAPKRQEDEEEEDDSVQEDRARDSGKKDSGKDAGKRDARAASDDDDDRCTALQTRPCDTCSEEPCVETCANGSWGECRAVGDLVGEVLDSGIADILGDAASVRATDGGVSVSFGDASVELPTAECPSSTECASKGGGIAGMFLSTALMGASFCAMQDAIGLPPPCTTVADCTNLGFGPTAMCFPLASFGSYCIQFCK